MQQQPTLNFGLTKIFFFIYRTLSMRQKTINLRNQRSFYKKNRFFPQALSHIPRWVRLVQKKRAKNSHAWAPLNIHEIMCSGILSSFFSARASGENARELSPITESATSGFPWVKARNSLCF
jgi:hypothetical protein